MADPPRAGSRRAEGARRGRYGQHQKRMREAAAYASGARKVTENRATFGRRDPLSVRYDRTSRRALIAAIRHRPKEQPVFVATPGPDLRRVDRGGRTPQERAFQRSAYYIVRRVPINAGRSPEWSLKVTWGPLERRGSRYGRVARLRMFAYRSGQSHTRRRPATSYVDRPDLRSQAVGY